MVHNIVDGMAKHPYEERYDSSLDEYVEDPAAMEILKYELFVAWLTKSRQAGGDGKS